MKILIAMIVVIVAVLWYLGWQTEHQPEPVRPADRPAATPSDSGGTGPRPAVDRQADFARQAQAMGVQLREYRPEANGAVIAIAWTGDVASIGGDYLQACLSAGLLRDFDLPGEQSVGYENGQRVWMARYHVKF